MAKVGRESLFYRFISETGLRTKNRIKHPETSNPAAMEGNTALLTALFKFDLDKQQERDTLAMDDRCDWNHLGKCCPASLASNLLNVLILELSNMMSVMSTSWILWNHALARHHGNTPLMHTYAQTQVGRCCSCWHLLRNMLAIFPAKAQTPRS